MPYHPDYTVLIACPERNIYVRAPMPETFNFDTQAEYQAAFAPGNGTLSNILKVVGVRPVWQAATAQVWQGNAETAMSLRLVFQAEQDAKQEVMKPINDLNMLTAAHENSMGMLMAPAAQISDQLYKDIEAAVTGDKSRGESGQMSDASSHTNSESLPKENNNGQPRFGTKEWAMQYISNKVFVQIGRYATFDPVVPTAVVQTFSTQPDENGYPMHAEVEFQFKPLFMLTAQDIAKVFGTEYNAPTNNTSGAFENILM